MVAKGCTRDNSLEFREVDDEYRRRTQDVCRNQGVYWKDEETGSD